MAAREVSGADDEELVEIEREYYDTPMYEEFGVPFKVAYCLNPIAKQPDHYDGGQRYCKRRATRKEEFEGHRNDPESFALNCYYHGGDVEKYGHESKEHLEDPRTVNITHGAYADDKSLKMDFTDDEQELYDSIMNDWPEIYDWPSEDEDPARYRILRRVAVNEVRAMREEEYLDNHEVHEEPIYDDQGVQIGTKEVENPLAREYRLLMSEVTDQMKELGLTPKEQQKMDSLASEVDKNDAISEIASDALHGEDDDYNPSQFEEGDVSE